MVQKRKILKINGWGEIIWNFFFIKSMGSIPPLSNKINKVRIAANAFAPAYMARKNGDKGITIFPVRV